MTIIDNNSMIMVFMSDYGKWVLSKSEQVFCDGTFDTAAPPLKQIYFLLGQMPNMSTVPCVFALLPNKETSTYRKQSLETEAMKQCDEVLNTSLL